MRDLVFQFVGVVLLADFISGLVHWAEDAYVRKETPVVGRWIGEANIEHHVRPRAFVLRGWWASSWDLVLTGALVLMGAWWLKALTWKVWLFTVISINANQVHKWAHRAPHENGRLITMLQKLRLLQTQRHHAQHHAGQKNSHYCSITNFLNPLLEEINFWHGVEYVIEKTLGYKRKPDISVKAIARPA